MSVRGTRVPAHLQLPIAGVTPPPTEKEGQRLFPTGNFRSFRPVYKDKTPPCNNACPTGEQIQKYLDYVKHERYLDGYLTIMEDNPMPSVTGRVCSPPGEPACTRGAHDEPIGIRSVERFLGDYGLALPEDPIAGTLPALNGTTVAIVGSGPAGLACAYHLRRRGYSSVIFEALDKPGGMLRAGIPHWHLPEEILDAEIAKLVAFGGIEIRCGVRAGQDISWDELRNYAATFLALGQDVGRRLPIEGIQSRGVGGALEFLREAGLGRPDQVGREVLVIGGGNTASDAARSAIRPGGGAGPRGSREGGGGPGRRQPRLGRGPLGDPAGRGRGHDRFVGERRGAADRPRGSGAGPGRGRAVLTGHLAGPGHQPGRARDRGRALRRAAGPRRRRRGPARADPGHGARGHLRHDPGGDRAGSAAGVAAGSPQRPQRDHHRGRALPGGRQRPGRRGCDARPVDGGGRAR